MKRPGRERRDVTGDGKGQAAEAFREKCDHGFRPRVDDARDSFAGALEDRAAHMAQQQAAARR
jgi:hypothetical protein